MWYSKILVAYDGSAESQKAIQIACEMAEANPAASLLFVHVLKLGESAFGGSDVENALVAHAERVTALLQEKADTLPNQTEVRLLKGSSPADLIVRCSADEHCDLIVMGSRGMSGFKGYLGSVSHAVLHEAHICVLIARTDAERNKARA